MSLQLLLATTHNFIFISHKIIEEADFDLASSSSNGLTRVLPPNTPDLCEDEGEKGGPSSNICTVMEPGPRAEQVKGLRTCNY